MPYLKLSASTLASVLWAMLMTASAAQAGPIDVSESVSGTSGNWTLDFTVTNNLPPNFEVYFFGVQTSSVGIIGSPGAFVPSSTAWTNFPDGGSSLIYNNTWKDPTLSSFLSPASLNGFLVHSTDAAAPVDVPWFAWGYGKYANPQTYPGPGCFFCGINPGFEGQTHLVAAPEPITLSLFGAGLFGIAGIRRRKARSGITALARSDG